MDTHKPKHIYMSCEQRQQLVQCDKCVLVHKLTCTAQVIEEEDRDTETGQGRKQEEIVN